MTNKTEGLIPKHGGYRKLKSFEAATLVYDLTVAFCDKYIDKTHGTNRTYRTRQGDQMVRQRARAGRISLKHPRHPAPRKRQN